MCPPYDVISPEEQAQLLRASAHNAVRLELPADEPAEPGSRYASAARTLADWRAQACSSQTRGRPITCPKPRTRTAAPAAPARRAGRRRRRALVGRAWRCPTSTPWPARKPTASTAARHPPERQPDLAAGRERPRRARAGLGRRRGAPADRRVHAGATSSTACGVVDDPDAWSTRCRRPSRPASRCTSPTATIATRPAWPSSRAPAETCLAPAQRWRPSPGPTTRACSRCPLTACSRGLDPSLTLEEAETRWGEVFHVEYYPVWDDAPAEQIDALIQQLASSGRVGAELRHCSASGSSDLFGILELRGRKPPPGALPAERSDAWKSLDVSLLHTLLVDPLIAETGRPREEVLSYTRSPHEAVARGARRRGRRRRFFLNPTPVSGVLAVADARRPDAREIDLLLPQAARRPGHARPGRRPMSVRRSQAAAGRRAAPARVDRRPGRLREAGATRRRLRASAWPPTPPPTRRGSRRCSPRSTARWSATRSTSSRTRRFERGRRCTSKTSSSCPSSAARARASRCFARARARPWPQGCARMEWQVLAWNTPSIEFYKRLGARHSGRLAAVPPRRRGAASASAPGPT